MERNNGQPAPQELIEQKMQEIVSLGNYEAAYLFSNEGLPLARATANGAEDADRLAEISLLFHDIRRLALSLGGIEKLREVLIEGDNGRKIVFRFFPAFHEEVILVAVISPRKSYRKLTNELQRKVRAIEF